MKKRNELENDSKQNILKKSEIETNPNSNTKTGTSERIFEYYFKEVMGLGW